MEHMPPFTFTGVRMLLAGIVILPLSLLMNRKGEASRRTPEGRTAQRKAGMLCGLLLFAADVSENARRKAENAAAGRNVALVPLPFEREELGGALGLGSCSLAAVTDLGFADALMQLLSAQWPEKYGETAAAVRERSEKANRRKTQKGSKRVGTRRTNV